ncbi:MAG: valine--tRNA ligase [Oscillospiraceae bacterium]|nr:valine--tRNA ligase [Oscillospiraceae bacterium]
MKELSKTYDPSIVEKRIYDMWVEKGCFKGVRDPEKKPFTIVIPPPNVTGQLHLGHAFDETLQDALIRVKRMQGYAALWVPGTDHAGIATQIKVEEMLRKEGKTRYDLGREKFIELVWDWKKKYGGRIVEQLKSLGSSCDWDRERFTMDEGCSRAVREVFVSLYEKGLIYKGNRIINWCPKCTTALSDAEVEYEEKPGKLWNIRYPVKDSDEYVVVATTRPETMLGDTGVAVHPDDERYTHLVGKTCILPLVGREIPIIADEYVEREFGTGCVKMTPCHDPNDFEVGKRHGLEEILILDGDAKIINGGKYNGLDRYEARKVIVEDLEKGGYLVSIEDHIHNVGTCYRCGTDVEPITSAQWFVKMKPLAKEAIRVVEEGEIKFVPDRFSKTYMNWMNGVRDWCISRQLWWGHRIPAWYCADCGHVTVSREDAVKCEKCGSANIKQDEDVLDTWFSSALWPFSTLGWPDKTEDLAYFYPTSVLVTGYDIIFFWVARMIFSGMEHMKEVPFRTVLFHGLIRDANGKKMSKSAGNGIDPIEMIEKFGADALRINIITGNSPGNDMRFYLERCEAMRNFANKIWNASRFVMMNLKGSEEGLPAELALEDKWILSKLNALIKEVTDNIERFELGIAATKLYDFIWDSFCDWYIELTKPRLNSGDEAAADGARKVLKYTLIQILKLLHPFMPFITEEIYQGLCADESGEAEPLMIQPWPTFDAALDFPSDEADMESLMEAIKAVRALRAEKNVPPSKKPAMIVVTEKPEIFGKGEAFLKKLAYAGEVTLASETPADAASMAAAVTSDAHIYIPLAELIDVEAEIKRVEKELAAGKTNLERLTAKLNNQGFVSKAPEQVVAAEREKAEKQASVIAKLEETLKTLRQMA